MSANVNTAVLTVASPASPLIAANVTLSLGWAVNTIVKVSVPGTPARL